MGVPGAIIASSLIGAGTSLHQGRQQRKAMRGEQMKQEEEAARAEKSKAAQISAQKDEAQRRGKSRSANVLAAKSTLG